MKKLIAILLLLALLLCGCGKSVFAVKEHHGKRFETVEEYDDCKILVDMETGVMYSISENGTMTVLLNWDGSPRCYPGFDAREDRP